MNNKYYLIALGIIVVICILFLDFSLFKAASKSEDYIDEAIKEELK